MSTRVRGTIELAGLAYLGGDLLAWKNTFAERHRKEDGERA